MRWPLYVIAEKRKSATVSGVQGRDHAGFASFPCEFFPAETPAPCVSPRYTMSCSSTTARPRPPEISWRTVTKHISPERPCFGVMPWMVETRLTSSPTSSRSWNETRRPANMRRGSGTGGRNWPFAGWPSGPRPDWRVVGPKSITYQARGSGSPRCSSAGRSRSAARRRTAESATSSSARSCRPIHSFSIRPMVLKKRRYEPEARGPLAGVRVLDLSRLFAGNLLTHILADFGAEVIKVEPPEGDTLRGWRTNGIETHWKNYARGKKSLCLDFKSGEARDTVLRLLPSASIFVESFRPGTLEAMGLAPEVLLRENPKLVIVRISGWGQDGPYRERPGFGSLVEGMSGFAAMNGYADRAPVLPPLALADMIAGLYGAYAVMIARREVERSGKGQVIDLPLLDPIISILGPQAALYRATGKLPARTGSRSQTTSPRNVFRTRDGRWIAISASIQTMAARLFRAVGRPEMINDPRFANNDARVRNAEECERPIAEFIATRDFDAVMAIFEREEITAAPVYDVDQLLADPHVIAREIFAD